MKDLFCIFVRFLLFICFLSSQSTLAHPYEQTEPVNLGHEARSKLTKLYQTIGLVHEAPEAIKVLDLLTESWSDYDTRTRWVNSLSGDAHPWEFSLNFQSKQRITYYTIFD